MIDRSRVRLKSGSPRHPHGRPACTGKAWSASAYRARRLPAMNRIVTPALDCGMPLIVEEMDGVKSAGFSWLLPAGTCFEPEPRQGMATVCAEMLMRGAGDLTSRQHADAMDRLGVGRSTDVGGYHIRIAATTLGERLGEALPLLVDMVRRPRMEQEGFSAARDLALQSLESLR